MAFLQNGSAKSIGGLFSAVNALVDVLLFELAKKVSRPNEQWLAATWRATCMAAVTVNEDDNVRIVILYLFSARLPPPKRTQASTFK